MDVILNEVKRLSQKYNKKEKVIERMLEKSIEMGYDIIKSKENIIEFIQDNVDSVNNLSTK
mgnify:CR=1 FL=1